MGYDFDKGFKRSQNMFNVVFWGAVVMILCVWIAYAVFAALAFKAVNSEDWSGGIKPVIEKVWCGAPGCFDAK